MHTGLMQVSTGMLKTAAELVVLTVTAYFCAGAAFVFLRADPGAPAVSVAAAAQAQVPREALGAFSVIEERNVFKAQLRPPPPPSPKAVPKALTDLPVSSRLRLEGTIYSSNPILSRVIVSEGGNQVLLRQGENFAGFLIKDIRRRAVVVTSKVGEEILLIDQNDAQVAEAASQVTARVRADLRDYFKDPGRVAQDVAVGVKRVGERQGLVLSRLREGSALFQAGLRQGDVLLSANGQSMSNPADLLHLSRLMESRLVSLEIVRGGLSQTLNIEVAN